MINSTRIQNLSAYFFIAFIVSVVLVYSFNVNLSELDLPLKDIYSPGDGRLTIAMFKVVIEESFFSTVVPSTNRLSAPFGFNLYDFPQPQFSNMLYVKLLGLFSKDPIKVFNTYYLSTYFLNAFAMFWALRRFRANIFLSISVALLFTFLPFHYWRLPHTLYSGYFFIPIWIYYLLQLCRRKPLFFKRRPDDKYQFDFSKFNIKLAIVLVLSSLWNFYYTFFFTALILFVLVSEIIYRNGKQKILSSLFFLTLTVMPFFLNMVPYAFYQFQNGENYQVAQRSPVSAESLGTTMATIVLPQMDHNIGKFDKLGRSYALNSAIFNESNDGILGVFGALGFLALIFIVFFNNKFSKILSKLSQFNLLTFLISTAGGMGTIFAFLVTPQIRAYNRMSMFIAAISFIAFTIILNHYLRQKNRSFKHFFIAAVFILAIGLFDLIPKKYNLETIEAHKKEIISDKEFINRIESNFDPNNSNVNIAQIPYIDFPESPGLNLMGNYEQFQGYIHSKFSNWSFGSMRGRKADTWWKSLSNKSIEEQIDIFKEGGFSGLMINKNGYKDNAYSIESRITKKLGYEPIRSINKKLLFYKLSPTGNKIHLPPIFSGFYDWEGEPGKFRWARKKSKIHLFNGSRKKIERKISFEFGTLKDRKIEVFFNHSLIDSFYLKKGGNVKRSYDLQLELDDNLVEFKTDSWASRPGGDDRRKLTFSLSNFIYE